MLTFTSDGTGAMGDLNISLTATQDDFVEGPEDYTIAISNPTSATGETISIAPDAGSVTTTINDVDTNGDPDGPSEWSISGPTEGDEGTTPQYTVSLDGTYGAGEVITVDLGLTDVGTNSDDYADVIAAIEAAVDDNDDVTFDPDSGTLTYTAPSDGATMDDLLIDLTLTNDDLIEGPEDFTLALTNATSTTDAPISIDTDAASVTTTINDTQGPDGDPDGPSEWSIVGDTSVDEGGNANYSVDLTGTYQAGEEISIQLDLIDGLTNNSCLLYTSPSPRDATLSRMPSSA